MRPDLIFTFIKRIMLAVIASFAISATPVSACACSHHAENHGSQTVSCNHSSHIEDHVSASVSLSSCDECTCVQPTSRVVAKSETVKLKKQTAASLPSFVIREAEFFTEAQAVTLTPLEAVRCDAVVFDEPSRGPPIS
jgi:hypothetical protein